MKLTSGTTETDYSPLWLATGFWASRFGREALGANRDVTALLVSYLTGLRSLGGLQSSWDGQGAELREVRDRIIRTRPKGPPCPA